MWDDITYPFLNLNGFTRLVRVATGSNFTTNWQHLTILCINASLLKTLSPVKMANILQTKISNTLLEWKLSNTYSNFTDVFLMTQRKRAKLTSTTLQWHHNERHGVSNHQPHDCLLRRLFRRRSKKHQSSASLAFVGEFTGGRWIPRTKGL